MQADTENVYDVGRRRHHRMRLNIPATAAAAAANQVSFLSLLFHDRSVQEQFLSPVNA